MTQKLEDLASLSRYFGRNADFVLMGGGNTSYKDESVLYIKASGKALAEIDPEGFVALDRKALRSMLEMDYPPESDLREERVKNDLLKARIFPEKAQRPSVESNFHEMINYPWVVHLHPTAINALTCSKDGKAFTKKLFKDSVLWVDYTDPGYTLAVRIASCLESHLTSHGKHPQLIFMQNHGVIASGNSPEELKALMLQTVDTIVNSLDRPIPAHISERARKSTAKMRDFSLLIRKAFGANKKIVFSADTGGIEAIEDSGTGPLTPDQIVYCRPEIVQLEDGDDGSKVFEDLKYSIEDFTSRRGYPPSIFLVKGIGIFGVGNDYSAARNAAFVFWDAARTQLAAQSFGGAKLLTSEESAFIDKWEVENYRRKLDSRSGESMAGMIAVITGAARGVGKGISEALAEKGMHVIIADINERAAEETACEISAAFGENRAVPIALDATDEAMAEELFCKTLDIFGGVDLLINNAGILLSGNVLDLEYEAFKKVIDINLNGSYLCSQKAAAVMAKQGGGDIIMMSSKSGKSGSKNNSAYSASKFALIGLAQSLAMDLIQHNIYVNALCPGNFLELDLWQSPGGLLDQYLKAGKVPGAASRDDVEKYYRKQSLMGRGCRVEDLIHTIEYILKQRGETGQAYNITQGQTMS